MFSLFAFASFLALPFTHSVAVPLHPYEHNHVERSSHTSWYHSDEHPVYALFRRQSDPTDGASYVAVGSPQWANAYPPTADTTKMPQAWVNALNAAVSAGKIPNIPQSRLSGSGMTVYPNGFKGDSPQVCSGTYQCQIPGDIWQAPAGYLGCGFDDGPLPPSDQLYQFLKTNNQPATHFFIGTNIIAYPQAFLTAFENGDDIAVHTWTHPYMTTLTNLQVVAEFGWTMQVIHNSTGGRLPRFWRPPYGDTDVRVAAIAKEVFGLTAILWNQDTNDWAFGEPGGPTVQKVNSEMAGWLSGPKNPGLIILEHELSVQSVQAFMTAYPLMKSNGWNVTSAARLAGAFPYQNSEGPNGPVVPANGVIVGSFDNSVPLNASSSSTTSTAGSAATSVVSKSTTSDARRNDVGSSFWFASITAGAVFAIICLFG